MPDSAAPKIPVALRALMAEIGPKWGKPGAPPVSESVQLMVARFSEVLAGAPNGGVEDTYDISYASADPRQVLDVHRPGSPKASKRETGAPLDLAPVVIFAHGGAFTDGEKARTPQIYANVPRFFARHGVVGVNMEYRQAPKWGYPAGAEDVALAVKWARENIARFGGDAKRIFIIGQSAGGAHTGSYAYDKRCHPAEGPGIAGHIVISGRVRADNLPQNPNARKVEAYYGTDNSRFDDLSPLSHVGPDSVPTFIAIAEYENPLIDVHCAELCWRLGKAKGRTPPFMQLRGHNHASIIAHFNTAEDALGRALLDFIHNPR